MSARQPSPWLTQTLRQAAALASVAGLPADSILCVRRLHSRFDMQRLRQAGGLLASADQLSRQLQRHAGEAARPARGGVSDAAPAVLFDDPAEMLACAARDWLDGRFAARWWWHSLLDGGELARGVVALWQCHPAHMPVALAALQTRAAEFAGRIAVADAEQLGTLLSRLHALPGARPVQPDWIPQLPDLPPDDPRQRFLTLGLLMAYAPGLARHAEATRAGEPAPASASLDGGTASLATPHLAAIAGATAAAELQRTQSSPTRDDAAASPHPGMTPATTRTEAEVNPSGASKTDPRQIDEVGFVRQHDDPTASNRAMANSPPGPFAAIAPRSTQPAQASAIARQAERSAGADLSASADVASPPLARQGTVALTATSARSPISTPISTPAPLSYAAHPARIESRYGGVFYLLNLALHLDFYADFTRPLSPNLALSPWDFLALVGERLVGRAVRHDALWPLLCSLAGEDEGGPDAAAGLCLATPPPLPDTLRPYLRGREWHEKGAANQDAITPTTWAVWLRRLLPPLRRRLAAALGVPAQQVGSVLCRQPARIHIAPGSLDVHFALDEHPLAIRLAGLDRNPGWIPAAGREVRFHYD